MRLAVDSQSHDCLMIRRKHVQTCFFMSHQIEILMTRSKVHTTVEVKNVSIPARESSSEGLWQP